MHGAGSALQNLSADEEVPEKEYDAIPRLKSSLNIKSKPKTKHQKGTYRRGRTYSKTATPTSNDPRVLSAAPTTLFGSASFDLDLSEQPSLDAADEMGAVMTVAEGSVLAPSQEQEDWNLAEAAGASGRGRPGDSSQAGNGASGDNRSNGSLGSAQSAGREGERQQEGSLERARGSGDGQGDWEASGATGSRQSASNTLATRDAQEQTAVRMQEPLPDQPQGYSLMWYGLQDHLYGLTCLASCRCQDLSLARGAIVPPDIHLLEYELMQAAFHRAGTPSLGPDFLAE